MDIVTDLSSVTLETERLILRPWRETDLEDFFAYASVPGVGEAAGWNHHRDLGESKRILDMFMSEKNTLAITPRETGRAIGSVGLHESWANGTERFSALRVKEIGYVLSKDYWGSGLMTEVVKGVISFCFGELGLDAVTCGHFTDNSRSRRVIEKCGFEYYDDAVYHSRQTGSDYHEKRYILLAHR